MPIKLIPSQLRHFNTNTSFPLTRLTTPMNFAPVFSRVFPFRIMSCSGSSGLPILKIGSKQPGFRKMSSFRSGSEFSKGKERGGEIRVSKSLVEDEAELSNWISELKSDSFRGRVSSDEDNDDGDRRRGSVRGRGRGGGRGSFDSFPRSSSRRENSGSDDNDLYPRRSNGGGSSRGRGLSSSFGTNGRGGRDSSYGNRRDSESGGEYSRGSRGGSSSFGDRRGGRDSSFGNRRGGSESSDDELQSRRGGSSSFGDRRGGSSSFGDRRGGSSSFGDRRGGPSSFGDRRGGSSSFGDRRGGSSSFGDRRGGSSSFGDRRGGSSSFGERRGGSSSFGDRRGGSSSFGDRRGGSSSFGDRRGGSSSFGERRGGSSSFADRRGGSSSRGGRDSNFENRHDSESDNELISRKYNQGGSRGGSSSLATRRDGSSRVGRDSDFESRRDGGATWSVKRAPAILEDVDEDSDDEDEDEVNNVNNFKDLLEEEDSEVDDEDQSDFESGDDDDEVVTKKSTVSFGAEKDVSGKLPPKHSPGQNDSYLSESRFDQCSVSPLSLKAVKDAGYEKMTMVQEATLPVILKGKDVLAKAKTGTGKTVAFLLPAIEVVVKSHSDDRDQKRPQICVLVICPTRELASQAAAEATKLLKYHPSIGVQVVIGGTRLAQEQKRIQANPCQILVATPGRLKDHIENTSGFATRMMGVKVLVLDEADHLLDMGFRKDIERIIAAVPKQRQTLLFSATVPEEVRQICHIALKRDHEFINAVQEGSEETHSQVKQMHLVASLDKHFSMLYTLLKEHMSDDIDYKVLVFCTTAMVTRLVADLLGKLNMNVREIHSRKPQSYRTRVSDEFRKSKGIILVTSDVSARGVDYPDVSLVIQVGLPSDREQYIHRLGRTGRKGKEGQGILMLAPWEEYFLSSIKDLPITKAPVPSLDPDTTKKVERALSQTEMKNKEAAYQAWLGYYNSVKNVAKDKTRLVELANDFSRSMGLDTPPAISKIVLGKMGLRNVPGLRSK